MGVLRMTSLRTLLIRSFWFCGVSVLTLSLIGSATFAAPSQSSTPSLVPMVGSLEIEHKKRVTTLEVDWPQSLASVRLLASYHSWIHSVVML